MTTMERWLDAYARAVGQPVPDQDAIDRILDLAGTSAHASVRQAAPVTCWLAAAAGLDPEEAKRCGDDVAAALENASG